MLIALPESARWLVAHAAPVERVRAVLRRVSAQALQAGSFVLTESARHTTERAGLGLVLSAQYRAGSVLLWITYFMGLVIFYALINWMPILFKEAGLAAQRATLVSALFPLGGVGAILFGWLMDRFNANRIIAAGFALTAVLIYLIGQSVGDAGLLMVVVFAAGAVMNTAQSSLPALAAAFYPTSGRATGVSWMLGIGRFGGIAGSFLVAQLALHKMGFGEIFAVVAVPGLVAAAALLLKQRLYPEAAGSARVAADVAAH